MPPRAAVLPLLVLRGDWAEARQLAEITRANGSPVERQLAVMLLGLLARYQGDIPLAWSAIRELLPEGPLTPPGSRLFPCAVELQRLAATLALTAGDLPTAKAWLDAHTRWLEWSGSVRGRAEGELLRAEYAWADQQRDAACSHVRDALELAAEPRQPLVQLAARRLLGEFAIEMGCLDEADSHLAEALHLARLCAAPYERALVLLARARLAAVSQRHVEARVDLDEVRAICGPLQAAPVLVQAEALASRILAGQAEQSGQLSPREIDVLRLVADGLTDAEVAEQLYISPRTVGQHLRSIYNKLGVSSRAAATRYAVQQGLV